MNRTLSIRERLESGGWRFVGNPPVSISYPIFSFNLIPLVAQGGEPISLEEARRKAQKCFTMEHEAEFALLHAKLISSEVAQSGLFIFFPDAVYEAVVQTRDRGIVYMGYRSDPGEWYLELWIGSTIPQSSFLLQPVTG